MTMIRRLKERGYLACFSHIEMFRPDGRSERFEASITGDAVFGITKRVIPEDLGRVKDLARRCDLELRLRLGVSPARDEVDVICKGQIKPLDTELLRKLRTAVESDICSLFSDEQQRKADTP